MASASGLSFRYSREPTAGLLPEILAVNDKPFRFLELPSELREKIYGATIDIKRYKRVEAEVPNNLKAGSQKLHDFSISATGLKCNFLASFNLAFVSKQVHREALSVIFKNATVQLYVDLPKYGINPKVDASVPIINKNLKMHPLLQEFARELTVVIQAEPASALLLEMEGYPMHWSVLLIAPGLAVRAGVDAMTSSIRKNSLLGLKRHFDLRALVQVVVHGFQSCKHLHIILHLDHLCLEDLEIVLGLFKAPNCSIILEEIWTHWTYGSEYKVRDVMVRHYYEHYGNMVRMAARKGGHEWFWTVSPSSEKFDVDQTELSDTSNYHTVMGKGTVGRRQRLWRPHFHGSTQCSPTTPDGPAETTKYACYSISQPTDGRYV
jgi:hypothetical protein